MAAPYKTQAVPTFYRLRQIQGAWFVELCDSLGAAMGIASEGGRPKAWATVKEATAYAKGRGLKLKEMH